MQKFILLCLLFVLTSVNSIAQAIPQFAVISRDAENHSSTIFMIDPTSAEHRQIHLDLPVKSIHISPDQSTAILWVNDCVREKEESAYLNYPSFLASVDMTTGVAHVLDMLTCNGGALDSIERYNQHIQWSPDSKQFTFYDALYDADTYEKTQLQIPQTVVSTLWVDVARLLVANQRFYLHLYNSLDMSLLKSYNMDVLPQAMCEFDLSPDKGYVAFHNSCDPMILANIGEIYVWDVTHNEVTAITEMESNNDHWFGWRMFETAWLTDEDLLIAVNSGEGCYVGEDLGSENVRVETYVVNVVTGEQDYWSETTSYDLAYDPTSGNFAYRSMTSQVIDDDCQLDEVIWEYGIGTRTNDSVELVMPLPEYETAYWSTDGWLALCADSEQYQTGCTNVYFVNQKTGEVIQYSADQYVDQIGWVDLSILDAITFPNGLPESYYDFCCG